jgi:uncharacterized protein
VKPGDHPDFFRLAPPPGASRQSSIVLDKEGRFWHEGARVDHPALEQALRTWISVHPDDGRPILTNGYDWCYFRVDDAPMRVDELRFGPSGEATLELFDGTSEPLDPAALTIGDDGVVYARVRDGKLEARFSRHAQTRLAEILTGDDPPMVRANGREIALAARNIQTKAR